MKKKFINLYCFRETYDEKLIPLDEYSNKDIASGFVIEKIKGYFEEKYDDFVLDGKHKFAINGENIRRTEKEAVCAAFDRMDKIEETIERKIKNLKEVLRSIELCRNAHVDVLF